MALFAVNTGCRVGEICNLQWEWEQQVPELETSVFRRNETDTSGSWGGAVGWMFTDHWGIQLDGISVDSDATYWNLGVECQF